MLLRHGKSDWHSDIATDFDRPLTSRGRNDAGKIARWLVTHRYIPDLIISSPAVRTQQTALRLTEEMHLNADLIRWESGIYEASLPGLLQIISKYAVNSRSLLVVGHNPGLDSLLSYLADAPPGRTGTGKLMTTAALAVLDCGDTAGMTAQHSLYLRHLIRPKDLN